MAGYRIFDIETVPDYSVWTPPVPRWSLAPLRQAHILGVWPSYDYKTGPIPVDHAAIVTDDPFPPPQAHRVVAISYIDLSAEDNEWYQLIGAVQMCDWASADPDGAEKVLLREFAEAQSKDSAILVSWNGRSFDLPVINMRSFRHGIQATWYYNDRDVRYRYSESGHCDLMEVFSDYGAARNMKLGDVARCIGLPGKTGEVSGHSVAATVAKGDSVELQDLVSDYCLSDSFQTALLYVRSRFHKGMIGADYYNKVIDSFAESASLKRVLPTLDLQTLKVKK